MDDRTFVLWRGQQRINFHEDDLTAERISAVFRVSMASFSTKLRDFLYNFYMEKYRVYSYSSKNVVEVGMSLTNSRGSRVQCCGVLLFDNDLENKVLNKASLRSKRFRSSYCAKFGLRERFVNELARKRFLRRLK